MVYINHKGFFYLFRNGTDKTHLIRDRKVDELTRIAVRQLINAKWVVKDKDGNVITTYESHL